MQDVFLSSDFISMLVLCVIVIAKSKFFHQQKNFTRNTTVTSNLLRVSTNVPRSKISRMGFYRPKTKPLDVAIFFASRQTF